jgi:hypothetical protein
LAQLNILFITISVSGLSLGNDWPKRGSTIRSGTLQGKKCEENEYSRANKQTSTNTTAYTLVCGGTCFRGENGGESGLSLVAGGDAMETKEKSVKVRTERLLQLCETLNGNVA